MDVRHVRGAEGDGVSPGCVLQLIATIARPTALRYSPSCHAAWAKMSGGSPGDRVQVFGTLPEQEEYRQQSGHDAHSKMVRAARPADARACAVVDDRGTVCAAPPETPAG